MKDVSTNILAYVIVIVWALILAAIIVGVIILLKSREKKHDSRTIITPKSRPNMQIVTSERLNRLIQLPSADANDIKRDMWICISWNPKFKEVIGLLETGTNEQKDRVNEDLDDASETLSEYGNLDTNMKISYKFNKTFALKICNYLSRIILNV